MNSTKKREKIPEIRFSHLSNRVRFLVRFLRGSVQTATQARRILVFLAVTIILSSMLSLFWGLHEFRFLFATAPTQQAAIPRLWEFVSIQAIILVAGLGVVLWIGRKLIRRLEIMQNSVQHEKHMEGLLPICSHCKKVRLEGAERTRQDSWIAIESYIQEHTDATFTHGLCPHCAHELYPTIFRTEQARSSR